MNDELSTFIIKELGKQRDRQKIIHKVCEQGSLNWREAERLFVLVEAKYRRRVIPPRSPWLLFLSIGTLIIGIGLLGFNLQIILTVFQEDLLWQVFHLQGTSYRITGVLTGILLSTGGIVGLWKAFDAIFPR